MCNAIKLRVEWTLLKIRQYARWTSLLNLKNAKPFQVRKRVYSIETDTISLAEALTTCALVKLARGLINDTLIIRKMYLWIFPRIYQRNRSKKFLNLK